jgi:Ser/Thr protein kinase RdoA (MazF antagonist)
MKLSTMKNVMDTVDSEWRSPLGEKILERWGYDEGTVFILRASANFIFVFKREGKLYFLRFNDSRERDYSTIEAELKLLQYLAKQDLKVAQPIPSRNGTYMEVVETDIGTFYAVVFEAVDGKHLEFDELSSEQAFQWGKALGKLHETLKQLPEELKIDRPTWQERLASIREILPKKDRTAYKEMDYVIKWAENLSMTKDNFGLIHYDFELDNVLMKDNSVGMLDFDDATVHWYVADIVYAMRDAGEFTVHHPIVATFVKGYQSETELDMRLLHESSGFERMHHVISYAELVRTIDIEESEELPDWLKNLQSKLCVMRDQYRQSFEKYYER